MSYGGGSPSRSQGGYSQSSGPPGPWVLEPVQHNGTPYLLDRSNGLVYASGGSGAGQWIELVGQWQGNQLVMRPRHSAGELFNALDQLLKTQQVRFNDLFASFDADGSGTLEPNELRVLVKKLLPDVKETDLRYFQVSGRGRGGAAAGQGRFDQQV